MKYFSILIKPSSSTCNLQCKYCFYKDVSKNRNIDNYGMMSLETSHGLIDNIFSSFKEETTITIAFQGGEPLCREIEFYKDFVNYVNKKKSNYHHVNYSIQTNGTLINDDWVRFFKENNFLVGVSIDGFQQNNDYYRGEGTFDKIIKSINLLNVNNVDFNILTVVTRELAKQPKKLYNFYKDNGFTNIQLIPHLPNFSKENGITPKDYYEFMNSMFELWFNDILKNCYISISNFDDMVRIFSNKLPYQCGMLGFCSNQFVVEADGNVYPCDFYCIDSYCIGNITSDSIYSLANNLVFKHFSNEPRNNTSLCENCKYRNICHGNCKRKSVCYYDDSYCAILQFYKNNENKLMYLVNNIYR